MNSRVVSDEPARSEFVREDHVLSMQGGVRALIVFLAAAVAVGIFSAPSFSAGLDQSAAERMARWRAARAGGLALPLPGTPDTTRLLSRLFAAGIPLGAPVMIRVFKAESVLEVWMQKNGTYVPFASYPICYFSGGLGPKIREGDRQTPEGFYTIDEGLLHHGDRWRRSLNIGYPNAFDRVNGRSGSNILVHGGCGSTGCFAMTDSVNAELYDLVAAALRNTPYVPVHVFPFRMTDDAAMAALPAAWADFWSDLKLGYDSFERTRLPPLVSVCGRRYRVGDAQRGGRTAGAIEICAQDRDQIPSHLITETARKAQSQASAPVRAPTPTCSLARASCRKFVALKERATAPRRMAGAGKPLRIP